MMQYEEFMEFITEYFKCSDPDHEVEMKWLIEDDGDTNWHKLFNEPTMARYGLFPHQAKYRIAK